MTIINKLNSMRQVIVIDLASSEKNQKLKSDPDYTVLLRGSMVYDLNLPKIYIFDMIRFREKAVKRNKMIIDYLLKHDIQIYKEVFGAYKDTFEIIKDILHGVRSVNPLTLSGNKEAKADPLTAIFEAGNINLLKGLWNQDFIDECALFPNGNHDDIVDCLAMLYHIFKRKPHFFARKVIY